MQTKRQRRTQWFASSQTGQDDTWSCDVVVAALLKALNIQLPKLVLNVELSEILNGLHSRLCELRNAITNEAVTG